jgi:PAS domain S-box-containing protein
MINLSDKDFTQFIEQLPVAIACLDHERRYIALNQACADINGLPHSDTIGKTVEEVVPELADALNPIFDKVYIENQSVMDTLIEGRTRASDETRYWLASYQPLVLEDKKRGLLVTAEEVTQQIFARESAKLNKSLLTDVLNSLFTFVGLLDMNGILLDANNAPLAAAGIDIDDVKGKYFWDCFWFDYSQESKARIKEAVLAAQNGESVRFDIDIKSAEGFMTIDFMMSGLFDEAGKLTHIIPSAIDISQRKRAEEELRLSQSRFETVVSRTVDGLFAFDTSGLIQFSNQRFEELTGGEVSIGKSRVNDFITEDLFFERLADLKASLRTRGLAFLINQSSTHIPQDVLHLYPSGLSVEVALSILPDKDEVLFLATVSDVSALYESNRALAQALEEKTVLLNEVHHRVKNNLQVMSSLLNLQANSTTVGRKTKEVLLDSQRRLKSMALIHELLYEREDFTHANLQLFTHRLLDLLQDSMTNRYGIAMVKDFTLEEISLSLNQMVPFGFLVTELVTNAYKHAFDEKLHESPTVTVSLQLVQDTIVISVSDNGIGIADADGSNSASLGSELISIFARQLKATLNTANDRGCSHQIKFKRDLFG